MTSLRASWARVDAGVSAGVDVEVGADVGAGGMEFRESLRLRA